MPKHSDFVKIHSNFVSEYGKEKGEKLYHAFINKHSYDDTGSFPKKEKEEYFISGLEFKEEDGEFFVEGFISTPDPDNNDIVGTGDLPEVILNQTDLVKQLNENPQAALGSYHHNRTEPPVCVVEKAELKEHPKTKKPSAWIRAKVNKAHEKFNNIVYEVKNKIINGFSIEFDSRANAVVKEVSGKLCRVFDSVPLFGYGLASRGVHPGAIITGWGIKEYIDYIDSKEQQDKHNKQEEDKMEDKEGDFIKVSKVDYDEIVKLKEAKQLEDTKKKLREDIKLELKELMPEDKRLPLYNKEEVKNRLQTKELLAFKEAVTKNAPIDYQWMKVKEVLRAHPEIMENPRNQLSVEERMIRVKEGREEASWEIGYNGGGMLTLKETGEKVPQAPYPNRIQIKEVLAFKDLETDTNKAHASWTYGSYYMSPVELNDIFQPVMVNQLNDERNVWNALRKEDFSKFSSIQFRARTGRNTEAAGVAESAALTYTGNVGRVKLQQPFSYYKVTVRVSGPEMALAEAPGGMGDIYADEVKWSTEDLMRVLELGIVGAGDGTSESTCLGFEGLIITTGNLYGRDVTGAGYTTLAAASVANASGARIKLQNIRDMLTACVDNGANQNDMAFFCRRIQQDFIKSIIQDLQMIVPLSTKVGFVGKPEIDGVPVFDAVRLNTDDLFLIDTAYTKIGIKVAPTYEETAKTIDARNGFIKIYFNLYSDAPNHNAWRSNLATS